QVKNQVKQNNPHFEHLVYTNDAIKWHNTKV
ncbi:MAG: hypothetical protein ACI85U_003936, partial [Candidatus Promineifilaceae bacterium]